MGFYQSFVVLFLAIFISNSSPSRRIRVNYSVVEENDKVIFLGKPAEDAKIMYDSKDAVFSFLNRDNPQLRYFTLNKRTGELFANKKVDRETICGGRLRCPVQFVIAVHSKSGSFEVVHVKITIKDVNDNYPRFDKSRVSIKIPENSGINDTFRINGATDADITPKYKVVSYQLLNDYQGTFAVKDIMNSDGSKDVGIVVRKPLDRESKSAFYNLIIIAKDGDKQSPKSGSLSVDVTITDANDHKPVFRKPIYEVYINENAKINDKVVRVHATDKDTGLNAKMTYRFTSKTFQKYGSLFSINETTGQIIVNGHLDYEKQEQFQLNVQASDQGNQPKTSKAVVIVHIKDLNDNAPKIKFNLLAGNGFAIVSENASRGAYVAHASVYDADSGGQQVVTCQIEKTGTFMMKELPVRNSFKIVVDGALNREIVPEYNITVICQDTGFPTKTARKTLRVMIKDENDHYPMFKQSKYSIPVNENYPLNEPLLQVTATDEDTGPNGHVTYRIDKNVKHLLQVDASTGIIYAINNLDRETSDIISFRIWAKDNGDPPKSSSAIVDITLRDQNDVTPTFDQTLYTFSVTENTDPGLIIGNVSATDNDLDLNGDFDYGIIPETNRDESFSINSWGHITALKTFDRENKSAYRITVTATDRGVRPLVGTATVIITVEDVNDNAPNVIFPNIFNNTVSIPHIYKRGQSVVNLTAWDRDSGNNGRLVYTIEKHYDTKDTEIFNLNNVTGEVVLADDLDSQHVDKYDLVVNISDMGIPPLSVARQLKINVYIENTTDKTRTLIGGLPRNTIIIVVLSIVTVILIIIIVAAIYVIRKKDIRKHNYRTKTEEQRIIRQVLNGSSQSPIPADAMATSKKNVKINPQASSSLINTTGSSVDTVENGILKPSHNGYLRHSRSEQAYMQVIHEGGKETQYNKVVVKETRLDDTVSDGSHDTTVTNDSGRGGSEDDLRANKNEKDFNLHKLVNKLDSADRYDDRYHGGCYRYPSSSDIDSREYVSRNRYLDHALYDVSNTRNSNRYNPSQHYDATRRPSNNPAVSPGTYINMCVANQNNNSLNNLTPNSKVHRSRQSLHYTENTPQTPDTSTFTSVSQIYDGTLDNLPAYSIADFEGLVDNTTSRHKRHEDDTATTTSGSYTINPDELVNEIDDLFFRDVL